MLNGCQGMHSQVHERSSLLQHPFDHSGTSKVASIIHKSQYHQTYDRKHLSAARKTAAKTGCRTSLLNMTVSDYLAAIAHTHHREKDQSHLYITCNDSTGVNFTPIAD